MEVLWWLRLLSPLCIVSCHVSIGKKNGYSLGTPRDHAPLVPPQRGVHGRLEQSLATQHPPWLHWSGATEERPSPPLLLASFLSSLSVAFSIHSFTDGSVVSQLG